MYKHFSAEFFKGNRRRLRELFVGTAPIVITANGAMQRNGDSTYPFRQDSSFWYLTGINDLDVILVMDRSKEYLIIPEQNQYQEVFDGAVNHEQLKAISGIGTVYREKEGWRQLGNRLHRSKHVATLAAPKPYVEPYGFYSNPARARLIARIKEQNEAIELLDLRTHITRMRMVKQPGELAAIQEAISITEKAIKAVRKRTYKTEYELEAAITATFRKNRAKGHAFTPIVSSGAKTCILHDGDNDGPIEEGDLILLDIGAEVENYGADISRTYTQEPATKRQKDVYQAVRAVQEYALSLLKPGMTIRENELRIEHFMGEKLRELGLIKTIDKDNVRKYYSHATSHYLGLDTHDVGDYDRPLEPNMVLTVEPGIYIPQEKIGIRIEDDVVITPEGHEILTKRLPRDSL